MIPSPRLAWYKGCKMRLFMVLLTSIFFLTFPRLGQLSQKVSHKINVGDCWGRVFIDTLAVPSSLLLLLLLMMNSLE